jgi:hypothetical protein
LTQSALRALATGAERSFKIPIRPSIRALAFEVELIAIE